MKFKSTEDYLIVDVFDCYIISDDEQVICQDRLTSSGIEISVDATEIRGGKGNGLIATVGGNKDLSITTEEPTFRMEALALQMGTTINTGTGVAYKSKEYTVSGGKITLDETPITGTVKVYGDTGKITASATGSGKDVTITGHDGEKVKVVYQYKTPATSDTIEINAKKFPTAKKIVLETIVIDSSENEIATLQLEIPKAKPDGSFSISTSSSKDPMSTSITWKAMADSNGKLGEFKLIPINGAE